MACLGLATRFGVFDLLYCAFLFNDIAVAAAVALSFEDFVNACVHELSQCQGLHTVPSLVGIPGTLEAVESAQTLLHVVSKDGQSPGHPVFAPAHLHTFHHRSAALVCTLVVNFCLLSLRI